MILEVLPDAGKILDTGICSSPKIAAEPTPESISRCGEL